MCDKAKLLPPKCPLMRFARNNFGRSSFTSEQDLVQNFFVTETPNIRTHFVTRIKSLGFPLPVYYINSDAGKYLFLVLGKFFVTMVTPRAVISRKCGVLIEALSLAFWFQGLS